MTPTAPKRDELSPRVIGSHTTHWMMVLAAGCFCASVVAQEAQRPIEKLSVVVITGTNDWEFWGAQRSPSAITVLSGERLEAGGINSVPELRRAVPNLAQSHGGPRSFGDNYVIRGLGNTLFLSAPAVGVYVDDAPFGGVIGYTTDLLAIDRVEVYRGPQGTRFGKNAEAGVINIVTRQPTDSFEAEASASLASFDTQQYRVSALGPLVKGALRFDLAGQYTMSDGFIRNTYLGTHADSLEGLNGRAALQWAPGDQWLVDFTATADKFNDGLSLVPLAGNPRETQSDFDGQFDQRINSQSLRVRGDCSGLALTSVTARREFQIDPFKLDLDYSPATGNTGLVLWADVQWSEELRLRPVAPDGQWDWLAGFFFSTDTAEVHRVADLSLPLGLMLREVIDYTENSDTYALFGEVTRTAWEKLDVSLGLRLEWTVRELHRTRDFTLGSPPPVHAQDEFFNAAPKLTVAYHFTPEVQAYGSTGVGFKPGGFSPFIDPPRSPAFGSERAWASEIGLKSAWFENKLKANVALFYSDVTDYQVEQFAPQSFDVTIANAPSARLFGVEVEVNVQPATGWEFSGFCGYTDARLNRFTDPFTQTTVSDTRPPLVPEFNAGVALQYRHSRGLFGRIDFAAFGDTFYDAANTPDFKQSAYGLLTARIGYERKHFGVSLFAENLTNVEYFTAKVPSQNAGATGRPRTFGVMGTARF